MATPLTPPSALPPGAPGQLFTATGKPMEGFYGGGAAAAEPGSLAAVLQNLVTSLQAMVGVLGGGAAAMPSLGATAGMPSATVGSLNAQLAQGLADLQAMGPTANLPDGMQFLMGRFETGAEARMTKDASGSIRLAAATGKPERVTVVEGINTAVLSFNAVGDRVA